jgi:hypothetical protein
MEIIPLIKIRKNEVLIKNSILKSFFQKKNKDKTVYILDYDGIEKNKPNLCFFQHFSREYDLWIDSGPSNIGDIVDVITAGGSKLTIRLDLFAEKIIDKIREITENEIFLDLNILNKNISNHNYGFAHEFDGIVNFNSRDDVEKNFQYKTRMKYLIQKKQMYKYENIFENFSYWKKLGIQHFIVDIDKIGVIK